jgi:hypothetical protein
MLNLLLFIFYNAKPLFLRKIFNLAFDCRICFQPIVFQGHNIPRIVLAMQLVKKNLGNKPSFDPKEVDSLL